MPIDAEAYMAGAIPSISRGHTWSPIVAPPSGQAATSPASSASSRHSTNPWVGGPTPWNNPFWFPQTPYSFHPGRGTSSFSSQSSFGANPHSHHPNHYTSSQSPRVGVHSPVSPLSARPSPLRQASYPAPNVVSGQTAKSQRSPPKSAGESRLDRSSQHETFANCGSPKPLPAVLKQSRPAMMRRHTHDIGQLTPSLANLNRASPQEALPPQDKTSSSMIYSIRTKRDAPPGYISPISVDGYDRYSTHPTLPSPSRPSPRPPLSRTASDTQTLPQYTPIGLPAPTRELAWNRDGPAMKTHGVAWKREIGENGLPSGPTGPRRTQARPPALQTAH